MRRYASGEWGTGGSCGVSVSGNSRWIWGDEGYSIAHIAHAALVAPGKWRVVSLVPKEIDGYAVRVRPSVWRILDARSAMVAVAYGPDGPAVALLLLRWGWGCFPS